MFCTVNFFFLSCISFYMFFIIIFFVVAFAAVKMHLCRFSLVWNARRCEYTLVWSQLLCFVAPPKLSAITVVANIMRADVIEKDLIVDRFSQTHIAMRTNLWYWKNSRKKYNDHNNNDNIVKPIDRFVKCVEGRKCEHNDHLFKLNRSTKSSSVLVNCL